MLAETLNKFGYPGSLIKEYDHWYLLLRPAQVTLGSMVLISKTEETNFNKLSPEAFVELKVATEDIEKKLRDYLGFDKINYKMLMMVDPEVHFHIFPRYSEEVLFANKSLSDPFWPGIADLSKTIDFDQKELKELQHQLITHII